VPPRLLSPSKAEVPRRSTSPHSQATPGAWSCCSWPAQRRRAFSGGYEVVRVSRAWRVSGGGLLKQSFHRVCVGSYMGRPKCLNPSRPCMVHAFLRSSQQAFKFLCLGRAWCRGLLGVRDSGGCRTCSIPCAASRALEFKNRSVAAGGIILADSTAYYLSTLLASLFEPRPSNAPEAPSPEVCWKTWPGLAGQRRPGTPGPSDRFSAAASGLWWIPSGRSALQSH